MIVDNHIICRKIHVKSVEKIVFYANQACVRIAKKDLGLIHYRNVFWIMKIAKSEAFSELVISVLKDFI